VQTWCLNGLRSNQAGAPIEAVVGRRAAIARDFGTNILSV